MASTSENTVKDTVRKPNPDAVAPAAPPPSPPKPKAEQPAEFSATYNPTDGTDFPIHIFGQFVEPGGSITVKDPAQIEKLKAHPEFQSKRKGEKGADPNAQKIDKAVEDKSAEARDLRAEAEEADAKARAAEQAARMVEAMRSPERTEPPVTNVPSNR